jgi:hypothetical protein
MATLGSKCKLMAALAGAGAFVALAVSPALAAPVAAVPVPPVPSLPCVPQNGGLYGVAAASATRYWTVGNTNAGAAVFNWVGAPLAGTPAATSYLRGVAATGAGTAVAVGYTVTGPTAKLLIMTGIPGTATAVAGPAFGPGISSYLFGVAATSASNAWAVGYTKTTGGVTTPLVLHGTGAGLSTWTQVPTSLPADSYLCGVTTTTVNPGVARPSSFAVGGYFNGTVTKGVILPGDGPSATATWTGPAFYPPAAGTDSYLKGVAAAPTSAIKIDAYAVGSTTTNTAHRGHPLIEVWNGTIWAQATVPDPGTTASRLFGVTIRPTIPGEVPKSDVWAVGFTRSGNTFNTFIVHDLVYKGTVGWAQEASANPDPNDGLYGVSASSSLSPISAWAVGRQAPVGLPYLTEHRGNTPPWV